MYNRGFSPARLIVPENATCINYKQGTVKRYNSVYVHRGQILFNLSLIKALSKY